MRVYAYCESGTRCHAAATPSSRSVPDAGGEGFPKPCQACAPKVLVLAPTRELATQIEDEARKFGGPLGVKSVCCYGGAPKGPQMASLRQGAHVCIATPGRLNDFLEAGMVDLYACRYLVFDEADRMLDMGFEPQIRRIVARCPDQRQTLFFTATWPREVRSLASEFLAEPVVICVEINQCSAMSPSSDEEPASPRHRAVEVDAPIQHERAVKF